MLLTVHCFNKVGGSHYQHIALMTDFIELCQ